VDICSIGLGTFAVSHLGLLPHFSCAGVIEIELHILPEEKTRAKCDLKVSFLWSVKTLIWYPSNICVYSLHISIESNSLSVVVYPATDFIWLEVLKPFLDCFD
jgi:hypothetical protein